MIDLPEPESDDFSRSTLLEDQRKRWRSGERTPVEAYLQRRPKLGENENLVLDLIYSEVLLREELQEALHADEYVRRFSQHADAIRRLLRLHEELKSHRTTPVITRPDPPGPKQRRRTPPRQLPQIPGYQIVAFIDGGGQGDVYQARHVRLDRPVALKEHATTWLSTPTSSTSRWSTSRVVRSGACSRGRGRPLGPQPS